MGRSLGLALYLLSARRRGRAPALPAGPRPEGPLVWFAAADAAGLRAGAALARRLRQRRADALTLVTAPEAAGPAPAAPGLIATAPPPDATGPARAFLDHWRPSALVLTGDDVPPAIVTAADDRGVALFLAEGRAPLMPHNPWRRAPGLMPSVLRRFRRILMTDATGLRYARRAGAPADRVEAAGWLDEGLEPLGCTEAERAALARAIGARPVWLAAGLTQAEAAMVFDAHAAALERTHRLLLLVVPAEPAAGAALAAEAAARCGGAALRSAEDDPSDDEPVYIADTEGEYGLWYRLAPVCLLGGTLTGPGPVRPPAEPALLGSAILHGPAGGPAAGWLERLDAARAARRVRDAAELAQAVGDLLSPERAAQLAHNAWAVATAGVETTERLAQLILDTLPAPAAPAPRPAPAAAAPAGARG